MAGVAVVILSVVPGASVARSDGAVETMASALRAFEEAEKISPQQYQGEWSDHELSYSIWMTPKDAGRRDAEADHRAAKALVEQGCDQLGLAAGALSYLSDAERIALSSDIRRLGDLAAVAFCSPGALRKQIALLPNGPTSEDRWRRLKAIASYEDSLPGGTPDERAAQLGPLELVRDQIATQEAAAIRQRSGGDPVAAADGLMNLASVLPAVAKGPGKISLYREAAGIYLNRLGPADFKTINAKSRLRDQLSLLNDPAFQPESEALEAELTSVSTPEQEPDPTLTDKRTNFRSRGATVMLLRNAGALEDAFSVAQARVRQAKQLFGPVDDDTALALNELAIIELDRGDYAAAEQTLLSADAALRFDMQSMDIRGQRDFDRANLSGAINGNLAGALWKIGRLEEAEAAARRSVLVRVRLDQLLASSDRGFAETTTGPGAAGLSQIPDGAPLGSSVPSLVMLGHILSEQGKDTEAAAIFERVIRRTTDPDYSETGAGVQARAGLAAVLFRQGAFTAAEGLYRRALAYLDRHLDPYNPPPAAAGSAASSNDGKRQSTKRSGKSGAFPARQSSDAIPDDFAALQAAIADDSTPWTAVSVEDDNARMAAAPGEAGGEDDPRMAELMAGLGRVLAAQGRLDEAAPLFRRAARSLAWSWCPVAVERREMMDWTVQSGDCQGHPDLTAVVADRGRFLGEVLGRPRASARALALASDMAVGRTRDRYSLHDGARREFDRFRWVHGAFVSAAWSARGDVGPQIVRACSGKAAPVPVDASEDALDRDQTPELLGCMAFEKAQWSQLSAGGAALQSISVRTARADDALGRLEAERRLSMDRLNYLQKRRAEIAAEGASTDGIDKEIADWSRRLYAASASIDARFPDYARLSAPQALTLDQTRALLGPNEAALQVLVVDDAAYVFLVDADGLEWRRAPGFGRPAMDEAVKDLRGGLEAPGYEGGPAGASAFDRKAAYRLYQALFAPFEPRLKSRSRLFIVTNGALTGLPLGVLVTRPPEGDDRSLEALRDTAWFADRQQLVSLPSLASLAALRCTGKVCSPVRKAQAGSASSTAGPEFFGVGAPVLDGPASASDGGRGRFLSIQQAFNGQFADVSALRQLPPLPGAQVELELVAEQFAVDGADAAVLLTGAEATEARLRDPDGALPELQSARYVSFATHGLLAGEGGRYAEPGLVLTPPASASEMDDGLLTASEVAGLTLSAQFVVLSACNTAGRDGVADASGLGGLAPAFFYAGARSLLVSHWSVSDTATATLMRSVFGNLQGGERRAEAFGDAVRALRNDVNHPQFAHPAFWGAFTFVGEPMS